MRRLLTLVIALALPAAACAKSGAHHQPGSVGATSPAAVEPDYSVWNRLLATWYDPGHGMNYAGLKVRDAAALRELRTSLARVDATRLPPAQQLAYWINLYNINVVGVVVDHYPVDSILDISSNPLIRHDVFKRASVAVAGGKLSLNDVENEKIRAQFRDPRIHFAINCGAKSCPPIRSEAYVGDRLDEQLDDQVRRFAAGPGVRIVRSGARTVVYTSKIMKWFRDDFDQWGGGGEAFLRRYLPAEKAARLGSSSNPTLEYDDYDWTLNDWRP